MESENKLMYKPSQEMCNCNRKVVHLEYALNVLKNKVKELEENILKLEKNNQKYYNS